MQNTGKSLFICVGDLSADKHAGKLINTLKKQAPDLDIWGMGGTEMQKAGARLIYNRESLTAIGLVEVIRYLPKLAMVRQDLLNRILKEKPDAMLLMDFGGFNVGFATLLRKFNKTIPIIYFISPQVWASRPWRINVIARAVSKMLVIFPFEEPLYKRKGVNAKFVGHPLKLEHENKAQTKSKEDFCETFGLSKEKPIIGVFPGSRKQEISFHASVVLEAIDWLHKLRPEIQFVISSASQKVSDQFQFLAEKLGFARLMGTVIKTISSDFNQELMTHSDLLWTKSGTTTLEAALAAKPMLIFYRGSWITYFIIMLVKTVKYVGWPNLLHGEGVVPELIQLDCRAEQLVRYSCDWLDVPGKTRDISKELCLLGNHLGEGDFTDNAAAEILATLGIKYRTENEVASAGQGGPAQETTMPLLQDRQIEKQDS